MVIRHDDVEAELTGLLDFRRVADATIDRDDQLDLGAVKRGERSVIQAIAVVLAVRHVPDDRAPQVSQALDQQRCARNTIGVVITINGDSLLAIPCPENPVDGAIHAEQVKRLVDLARFAGEKCQALGRIAEVTSPQNAGEKGVEARRGAVERIVAGGHVPAILSWDGIVATNHQTRRYGRIAR